MHMHSFISPFIHFSPYHLNLSWDDTYAAELANFASNGDEGEVWFGEDSLFRVLRWFDGNVNAADTAVLDVGCGNGITSVHLAAAGYKDVVGVDYSEAAIALSRKVAEKHKAENVAFEVSLQSRITHSFFLSHCNLAGRRYLETGQLSCPTENIRCYNR